VQEVGAALGDRFRNEREARLRAVDQAAEFRLLADRDVSGGVAARQRLAVARVSFGRF